MCVVDPVLHDELLCIIWRSSQDDDHHRDDFDGDSDNQICSVGGGESVFF